MSPLDLVSPELDSPAGILPDAVSYVRGSSTPPLLGMTIGKAFDNAVARWSDRTALVVRHQNIRWSYADLAVRVDAFAAGLLSLGSRPGDRIGIWAPNGAEWIIAQFATAKAGLILVNINPAYRADELRYVLRKVADQISADSTRTVSRLIPRANCSVGYKKPRCVSEPSGSPENVSGSRPGVTRHSSPVGSASPTREEGQMSTPQLFVVRRCDGFYRFWHDITDPAPMRQVQAVYDRLTCCGTRNTRPDDTEYYEIFAADPVPGWRGGHPPLVRRLHQQDARAIESHLLGLDHNDRRLRFFREATDIQIRAYVRDIEWDYSLLLGAIHGDRIVGMAEALFDRATPSCHAEIAVSVDSDSRGRGLGGFLVAHAVDRAGLLGMSQTSLSFLRENRPIQRIVRALGGHVDMEDLVGTIPTNAASADLDRRRT